MSDMIFLISVSRLKSQSHTHSYPLRAGSPPEHRPEEPDVPKAQVNALRMQNEAAIAAWF